MAGSTSSPRSRARRAALQAIYQWQMTAQALEIISAQFRDDKSWNRIDEELFFAHLYGVPANVTALDACLQPILDRPVAQLDAVERAILRMGAFELTHREDIPWRVVINECVELAREFGAEQSHKYVNGILDNLARRTRDEARRAG
ncbi:MAG: transcription antitermination factor NusB [Gammaproteobacteria bacterium]|nr:MAG: transcription antitermination factor NusB [Gammaproteobacteria bacterium]